MRGGQCAEGIDDGLRAPRAREGLHNHAVSGQNLGNDLLLLRIGVEHKGVI